MPGIQVVWLHDIKNKQIVEKLKKFPTLPITLVYRKGIVAWIKKYFIPEGLRQIRTGRGSFPPVNVGLWRMEKLSKFGISHSLGILSGRMYAGFSRLKVNVRAQKAKGAMSFIIRIIEPFYFRLVEEGTTVHRPYPVVHSTLTATVPRLGREMDIALSRNKHILGVG